MILGVYDAETLCSLRTEWVGRAHFCIASHPFEWYTFLRRSQPWGRLVAIRQVIRGDGSIYGRRRYVERRETCVIATTGAVLIQRLDDPHGPIFLY